MVMSRLADDSSSSCLSSSRCPPCISSLFQKDLQRGVELTMHSTIPSPDDLLRSSQVPRFERRDLRSYVTLSESSFLNLNSSCHLEIWECYETLLHFHERNCCHRNESTTNRHRSEQSSTRAAQHVEIAQWYVRWIRFVERSRKKLRLCGSLQTTSRPPQHITNDRVSSKWILRGKQRN